MEWANTFSSPAHQMLSFRCCTRSSLLCFMLVKKLVQVHLVLLHDGFIGGFTKGTLILLTHATRVWVTRARPLRRIVTCFSRQIRCTFLWLNNTLRMWTLVSWMNVVCGCVLDLCPTLTAFWSFGLDAMARAVWKMSAGAIHHWSKQKHLTISPPRRQYHAQPIRSPMAVSCRTSCLKNSMFSWCCYILRLARAF